MIPISSKLFTPGAAGAAALILALTLAASAALAQEAIGNLLRAVNLDDVATVQQQLDRGYDVNSVDDSGDTLLVAAAREGSAKVVNLLIQRRAKVDTRIRSGDSAIMIAALKGHLGIVKALRAAGAEIDHDGWTALHYAAFGGYTEICKFLLDQRANIDARAPNGATPLMLAARQGHFEAAKLLVWEIADPNLKTDLGASALGFAIRGKHAEIEKLLRVAGAKD